MYASFADFAFETDGNRGAAAKQLAMSPRSLNRWIERLGVLQ
jgi:hypothetical protein